MEFSKTHPITPNANLALFFWFVFLLERLFKYSRKLNIVLKFKVMFQYDIEKVFYRVVRVGKLSVFIKSNYFRL